MRENKRNTMKFEAFWRLTLTLLACYTPDFLLREFISCSQNRENCQADNKDATHVEPCNAVIKLCSLTRAFVYTRDQPCDDDEYLHLGWYRPTSLIKPHSPSVYLSKTSTQKSYEHRVQHLHSIQTKICIPMKGGVPGAIRWTELKLKIVRVSSICSMSSRNDVSCAYMQYPSGSFYVLY